MKSIRGLLDGLANVVFIVIALLFAAILIKANLSSPKPLQPGDQLAALPGWNWQRSSETLVVALKNGCHFCEASMPFYKQLYQLEKENQLSARIVAVLPDDNATAKQFLRSQNLGCDYVPSFDLKQIHVTGTPTLILVNQKGQVLETWVGQLPQEVEEEVVHVLKSAQVKPASDPIQKFSGRGQDSVKKLTSHDCGAACSSLDGLH